METQPKERCIVAAKKAGILDIRESYTRIEEYPLRFRSQEDDNCR